MSQCFTNQCNVYAGFFKNTCKRMPGCIGRDIVNPEKPDVPLNKNDAFQKVQ